MVGLVSGANEIFKVSKDINFEYTIDILTTKFKQTNLKEKYIYKFGDKPEVLSDEMEVIPYGVPKINVSQHIFDFISLQIPIKKLHPKFRNEVGGNEKGIMVYSDSSKKAEVENESIDPRWADLLKLKDFKN